MKFWSKSMINRITIYVVMLLIMTVGLMGYLSYDLARRNLTALVYQQLDSVIRLKRDALQAWVTDQRQEVTLMAAQVSPVNQWASTLVAETHSTSAGLVAYTALQEYFQAAVSQKAGLRELLLLDATNAQVLVSTDADDEGRYQATIEYYGEGKKGIYVSRFYPSLDTGEATMTVASPIYDGTSKVVAVLVAHLNLDRMHQIIFEGSGLGPTGEIYLVDKNRHFIVWPALPEGVEADIEAPGILAVAQGYEGKAIYENYRHIPVAGGYRWLTAYEGGLIAEVEFADAIDQPAQQLAFTVLGAGTFISVLLTVGAFFLVRHSVYPLRALTEVARQVADGNLEQQVPIITEDEVGVLGQTFNRMTERLRTLYAGLEQQVAVRTQALEKRSRQFQAAAQVANAITAIRDMNQLLNETVRLIPKYFDFYHAAIFIVDEAEEFAVLRAASSEGGQRMLARGHRLRLGQGMVGAVARIGRLRIASDVDADGVFVPNPDMLRTRSEMALPLTVRGHVLGVLDVQSEREAAFTDEDAAVLQTMAEQIALAIQNARLLRESERAVRELERRYGEQIQMAWQARLARNAAAYRYTSTQVESATSDVARRYPDIPPEHAALVADEHGERQLIAPILMREQVLGSIVFRQGIEDQPWSDADIALLEATCDQIGLALDNARLLDESRERVARERLTGEISARIRASATDVDAVLQTTLRELGQLLHATGTIHLANPENWTQISPVMASESGPGEAG